MKVEKCKKSAMRYWGFESNIQIENYMKSISPKRNPASRGFSRIYNSVKRFFGFKDTRQKAKDALAHDIQSSLLTHSSPYTSKEYQKIAESALLSIAGPDEEENVQSCFPEFVNTAFDENAPREVRRAKKEALQSFLQSIIPNKELSIPDPRPLTTEEQFQLDCDSIRACGSNANEWLNGVKTLRTSKQKVRAAANLLSNNYSPEEFDNACRFNLAREFSQDGRKFSMEEKVNFSLESRMKIEKSKKDGTYGVRRVIIPDWVSPIGSYAVQWAQELTIQGGLIRKRIPLLQDLQKEYSNEEIDTACKDLVMQNLCHRDLTKRLQDSRKLMEKVEQEIGVNARNMSWEMMKRDPVNSKEAIKSLVNLKKEGYTPTEIEQACTAANGSNIKASIENSRLAKALEGEYNDNEILTYAEKIGPSARSYAAALLAQINGDVGNALRNCQRKKIRDLLTLESPSTPRSIIDLACKKILDQGHLRLSIIQMVNTTKRTG